MKRVALIQNPVAARANPKGLESIISVLEAAGYEVAVHPTEGHGHAVELAAAAAKEGVDIVAAYGGDGTAMQAAEGLHGSSVPLGLVPGGTGNLLAANLGISRNLVKAAEIVATGTPRTIDLGRLETAAGRRYFAVGCGAGYDADLVTRPTPESKRRWGVGAYIGYVVRTAHKIKPVPFTIHVDGKAAKFDAASVIVANCPEVLPPVLSLGPEVTIDDGVLDVVVLKVDGFFEAAFVVWQLIRGRDTNRVQRIRGAEVRVESDVEQVVQADGDACGITPFTASIVPGALAVMVPAAK